MRLTRCPPLGGNGKEAFRVLAKSYFSTGLVATLLS